MRGSIVIIRPPDDVTDKLERVLRDGAGVVVDVFAEPAPALERLEREPADVVVADEAVLDGANEWLERIERLCPDADRLFPTEFDYSAVFDELNEALDRQVERRELEYVIQHSEVTEEQVARARRVLNRMHDATSIFDVMIELGYLSREDHQRLRRGFRASMSVPEILHLDGVIDRKQYGTFCEARAASPERSEREMLVTTKLVSEEQYLRALADHHELTYMEPEVGLINNRLLDKTSLAYLRRNLVVPLLKMDDRKLDVVMADPLNRPLLEELEQTFESEIRPCCCASGTIRKTLNEVELQRKGTGETGSTVLQYRELELDAEDDSSEDAVQVVDYLLAHAIDAGASDLHIEPLQKKLRVRIRVDGVLRELISLPRDFAPRVIARLKVLADADIAERRLHQDGRIMVRKSDRNIDIRFSAYASNFGENLVLRILDSAQGLMPLDGIGFEPAVLTEVRDLVLPGSSGLVVATGPTGCGKTTTLYSFLGHLNVHAAKIITCEDPVEYVLEGVVQCNINEKTGPTFADSLRAIVRQDPDIILVGEIRDGTSAALAIEAALTGHKVFSSLHTEDAVGASARLLDMGVEPFMLASTLSAVVAQRLVRRVCGECKQRAELDRHELRYLGLEAAELAGAEFVRGAGCPACSGTGYKGRAGIFEVLLPDEKMRDLILARTASTELRRHARTLAGFRTLQESGVILALRGVTTLEEVVGGAPRDDRGCRIEMLREIAREWRT